MRNQAGERGFALIASVWFIFLLSLIALGLLSLILTNRRTVQSLELAVQDRYTALSVVEVFMKNDFYDGQAAHFFQSYPDFFGEPAEVSVAFEVGKVNLNLASVNLLSAMFMAAGVDEPNALTLSTNIVDWRDQGEFSSLGEDERIPYLEHGVSYGPRNSPFETLGELEFVAGMDADLFRCVKPALTVVSRQSEALVGHDGSSYLELEYSPMIVRQIVQWAHDRAWAEEEWPDPASIEAVESVLEDQLWLGNRALSIVVTLGEAPAGRRYEALLRFKSVPDRNYVYLSPLKRDQGFVQPGRQACLLSE